MADSSASFLDNSRIHRLLRSLVGVADVSLAVTPEGRLRSVAVLRDGNVQEHQLVRNVVSGLKAGFGVRLAPTDIEVVLQEDAWRQRPDVIARAEAAKTLPVQPFVAPTRNGDAAHANGNGKHSNGNGNDALRPRSNGTGGDVRLRPASSRITRIESHSTVPRAVSEPVPAQPVDPFEPRLDAIDVERHGAAVRCRVSVRVGEHLYSAVAEVRDAAMAEAELAARVTLDALRAGGLTTVRLDGVSLTTIADMVYVVAAVRATSSAVPRASAAPLQRDMANAAAAAVLRANGPVGTVEQRAALNGTV